MIDALGLTWRQRIEHERTVKLQQEFVTNICSHMWSPGELRKADAGYLAGNEDITERAVAERTEDTARDRDTQIMITG